MPVEPIELLKLITSLIIITIPGYLWSFLFFKHITRLERLIFGFVSGLGILTCGTFLITTLTRFDISQNLVFLLFALYAISAFIFIGQSIHQTKLPKINLTPIKNKKFILLIGILCFTFFIMFLPHLSNNYYLPFHVDEWIHWSYSQTVLESSSITFINPYIGLDTVANPEIGFHTATACLSWFSGADLLTIFLFMPSIIGVCISLSAFNIGERSERKFGLEFAFLIGFIPTTVRFLGPSFYVPVTLGLLLLIFIIWFMQLKKPQGVLFIAPFMFFLFIVHPPTAIAGIIALLIYTIFLALEKNYKVASLTGGLTAIIIITILIAYYLGTRWNSDVEMLLQAAYGKEYLLWLPAIGVDFAHLGVITWVLFVIGIYYSFTTGKSFKRTMSFSCIAFITIIGFYSILGYGVPIIYERTFLYLFLLLTLIAGVGLSELRKFINSMAKKNILIKNKQWAKNIGLAVPIIVFILLSITAVPAHIDMPYYQMVDEKDYETLIWIRDNIEDYRDENHSFDRAAVHPLKASPFSAITGVHIISSSMHPIYGYSFHSEMEDFLSEKCVNTSFLEQHQLSIIYGHCENEYLTEIYENTYLYYGTPPKANFTYSPDKPTINDTIYFTSNSTRLYSRIVSWKWDFGDGNISHGETIGLEFDGINDYVDCGNDSNLDFGTDDFTIELFFKCSNITGISPLISKGRWGEHAGEDHWWIYFRKNGTKLWMGVESEVHIISGSFDDDKWHHLVCVRNGNHSIIYFDNTSDTHDVFYSGKNLTNDEYLCIGRVGYGSYFKGLIDNVKIYNRTLNSTEIQNNYNGNVTTNGLISWWKMNETGNIAYDHIGINDGSIHGANWINQARHKYSYSGTYQVTLTVSNEDGLTHSISKNITIS